MSKKWLYTFTINRETETEKREKSTNEDGKEVEIIEKVKEKQPVEFLIQKPNRKLFDEAELFYGVKMSEGIKAGLLTRNLLAKRYEDDGGAFSEAEKQRYSELYLAIYNKEEEYQRLQLNLDNKPQELKDTLAQDLLYELSDLRRELTDIENAQSNIFDQTAENRAKNQTIMWWVLNLSHWKEFKHKDAEQFFGAGAYDEKLDKYDDLEEEDDNFMGEAIRKLAYFVSFWYMGRATSKEEFKTVEELYDSENKTPEDEAAEEQARSDEEAKQEALGGSDFDEELEEKVNKQKATKKTKATTKKKTATKKKPAKKAKAKKAEAKVDVEPEAKEKLVEEVAEKAPEEEASHQEKEPALVEASAEEAPKAPEAAEAKKLTQ
jgi:hypothetical protein